MTKAQKEKIIREARRDQASKAAKALWAKLTPKQRSARGRHAIAARWAKKNSREKGKKP